jgi:hypothetical protein
MANKKNNQDLSDDKLSSAIDEQQNEMIQSSDTNILEIVNGRMLKSSSSSLKC